MVLQYVYIILIYVRENDHLTWIVTTANVFPIISNLLSFMRFSNIHVTSASMHYPLNFLNRYHAAYCKYVSRKTTNLKLIFHLENFYQSSKGQFLQMCVIFLDSGYILRSTRYSTGYDVFTYFSLQRLDRLTYLTTSA